MSNPERIGFRNSETAEENKQEIVRHPRLNLAIGPNCPVRCEGCYNNFGESFSNGGSLRRRRSQTLLEMSELEVSMG